MSSEKGTFDGMPVHLGGIEYGVEWIRGREEERKRGEEEKKRRGRRAWMVALQPEVSGHTRTRGFCACLNVFLYVQISLSLYIDNFVQ